MAREKDEGHVANIIGSAKTRKVSNLEWGVSVRVKDLRGILNRRLASGIHELLDGEKYMSDTTNLSLQGLEHTCRKTFPKMRSVSSRNTVENITVTRSGEAWT